MRALGLGFRVWGALRFRVWGLRALGFGFRAWGFRVSGLVSG